MTRKKKFDLILIPMKVRIWIDIVLAIAVFGCLVALPLVTMIDSKSADAMDFLLILTGVFVVTLLLLFAYKAIKNSSTSR